jgi:hypothetical protein
MQSQIKLDSAVLTPVCGRMGSATSAVGRIIALRMNTSQKLYILFQDFASSIRISDAWI